MRGSRIAMLTLLGILVGCTSMARAADEGDYARCSPDPHKHAGEIGYGNDSNVPEQTTTGIVIKYDPGPKAKCITEICRSSEKVLTYTFKDGKSFDFPGVCKKFLHPVADDIISCSCNSGPPYHSPPEAPCGAGHGSCTVKGFYTY